MAIKDGVDGWEEIIEERVCWVPKNRGDILIGVLIKRDENRGPRGNLTFYEVETAEVDEDGEKIVQNVLGTTVLNKKMSTVPIGYEVAIMYCGEKPSQPPKKPLKIFRVCKRPGNKDHTTGAAGEDEPETDQKGPQMVELDNRDVVYFVDGVEDDLRGEGKNLSEPIVFKKARKQGGGDKKFMESVKEEIRRRNYGVER